MIRLDELLGAVIFVLFLAQLETVLASCPLYCGTPQDASTEKSTFVQCAAVSFDLESLAALGILSLQPVYVNVRVFGGRVRVQLIA